MKCSMCFSERASKVVWRSVGSACDWVVTEKEEGEDGDDDDDGGGGDDDGLAEEEQEEQGEMVVLLLWKSKLMPRANSSCFLTYPGIVLIAFVN